MEIMSQGQMSIWLGKVADSLKGGFFPRCMPYASVRVAQFDDDEDYTPGEEDLVGVSDFLDEKTVSDLKTMADRINKVKNLKAGEVIVDVNSRPRSMGLPAKNRINKKIHDLALGFHKNIPLGGMFDALLAEHVIPVQEDGTKWEGFLVGGKECGSMEARAQRADIDLAVLLPDMNFALANVMLHLSWCKIGNEYEVVAYVG